MTIHRISWEMTGSIDFDTDETDPIRIMADFEEAHSEGCIDVLGTRDNGEIDDFRITEVDEVHHHVWIPSYGNSDWEWCSCGGSRKTPHA